MLQLKCEQKEYILVYQACIYVKTNGPVFHYASYNIIGTFEGNLLIKEIMMFSDLLVEFTELCHLTSADFPITVSVHVFEALLKYSNYLIG